MTDGTIGRLAQRHVVDRFGTVASCACAVHCAASALIPGALGALGVSAWLGHEAEWGFTAAAIVFASTALVVGWRRHRSRGVALVLGAGIAGLALARVTEAGGAYVAGTAMGVFAGAALIAGHIYNIRVSRRCSELCASVGRGNHQ